MYLSSRSRVSVYLTKKYTNKHACVIIAKKNPALVNMYEYVYVSRSAYLKQYVYVS